ncbi:MAG TPA: hypothetical protein VFC07_08975 [Verrucomicrobiae bacterium]|nr:hypothetical protein [Verrucomicrobiae bacterium]
MKPNEERAFLEAAPPTELVFSTESCLARPLRRAIDHPFFDKYTPALAHEEFLLEEALAQDEWF